MYLDWRMLFLPLYYLTFYCTKEYFLNLLDHRFDLGCLINIQIRGLIKNLLNQNFQSESVEMCKCLIKHSDKSYDRADWRNLY